MIGVAISGRAGAGKSTLAADLEAYGFTRIAFGDALKAEVLRLYGLHKFDPGGREKLIEHGDRMRESDPYYWIRPVIERERLARVCGFPAVIDDVRFCREATWARRAGLILVRVDAPLALRRERLAAQGLDPDFATADGPGETELELHPPAWDVCVWNDGEGRCRDAAARIAAQAEAATAAVRRARAA